MTEDQRRTLAAAHGLDPDTATEAEVVEALVQAAANPTPVGGEGEGSEGADAAPAAAREVVEPDPEPALTATVSRAQLDEQQRRLAELEAREARRVEEENRRERDGLVTAALHDGRIAPSERETWRAQLDRAPEATATLLATLRPNTVPVEARGHDGDEGSAGLAGEGTGWFDSRFAGQGA